MYIKTRCGGRITIPAATQEHLRAHPESWKFLPEAISRLTLPTDGRELSTEVDLGRIIGRSGCVETPRVKFDEEALFALRHARAYPSRIVTDVTGPEIRHLAIKAVPAKMWKSGDRRPYNLVTAYIGSLAPREPWNLEQMTFDDFQESMDFWTTHALTYDPTAMSYPFYSSWSAVLASTSAGTNNNGA